MNAPWSGTIIHPQSRWGLVPRFLIIVALLIVETLLISGLIQSPLLLTLTGAAKLTHDIQHWLFRYIIAYAGSFAILLYLRGADSVAAVSATARDAGVGVRIQWLLVHAALLVPFALLSTVLYGGGVVPFPVVAIGWHVCGLAAATALFSAAAPLHVWLKALRQTGSLPLFSLVPAAAALLAYRASQLLWAPAAAVTFRLAQILAQPFCPSLRGDPTTLILSTGRFSVQVSEVCSGLEGVGLMLAFCTAWLWYFRREYVFPRALIIVPSAVLLVFLLNAVRIAALVLIGDAGYQRIAVVGFHSQAGWIAFNLAALGIAIIAKRSSWLNRQAASASTGTTRDATAAYLMPLLVILASGMISHALSGGFEYLYPLRLICAVIVLWVCRRSYLTLDWRFSWRGISVGVGIFCVWAAFAHFLLTPVAIPGDLAKLSLPVRDTWIACRVAAAIITVPIAEELAYRGYLMRRIVSREFDALPLPDVTGLALVTSALAFGIMHGGLWLAGIAAGLAYGLVAIKTGKIGESFAAHATTNALIAIQVLLFGQWQLW